MSLHGWPRIVGLFSLVALLLGSAGFLQLARERRYPRPAAPEEGPYITSGKTARRLALGYSAVAADLYWIRAILYYGGTRIRLAGESAAQGAVPAADGSSKGFSAYGALYPLLDLATSLDPRFNIAYRFGAIFLAEPFPGGAGRPDHAIALLEKGVRERPDKWEYMQDIGFVHYWWRRDFRSAAAWFERASDVPGAPWFLRSLAATTLAEGGDRRSSLLMWSSILASAEIDWLRREAERRLLQLSAMDEMDKLQEVADRAKRSERGPLDSWQALQVAPAPRDPSGVPYEIVNGRVRLSPKSVLFPLPDEPRRLGSSLP